MVDYKEKNGNLYKNIWRKYLKESMHKYPSFAHCMVTCKNFASRFRNLESTFAHWDPLSQVAKSTSNAGLHRDYTVAIHFNFRTLKFQFRKVRNCSSAWCSCLTKAISSSFQLQIVHGLKNWILDFLSFEMVYRM